MTGVAWYVAGRLLQSAVLLAWRSALDNVLLQVEMRGLAARMKGERYLRRAERDPGDTDRFVREVIWRHGAELADLWTDAVDAANRAAVERLRDAHPILVDVRPAIEVVPGMRPDLILHAGPPIEWERMSGPMRGAVVGALLYEGRASSPEEAEALASSGRVHFEPCHHHAAVGPMAGITTASMPVFVVENRAFGLRLSEYHTGYRAFRRDVLETVNFQANNDGFVFDQEIIAQVVAAHFRIEEIAVPTRYFPEASSASFVASSVYGLRILAVLFWYLLNKWGVRRSRRFDSLRARYTRLT